mmetsp:Transcript_4652/g.13152  ORF Transcript_4652/g.13152 Transcript_4652/m.13152 type:complete len:590 (-) Transcript_4652:116-1885(-)
MFNETAEGGTSPSDPFLSPYKDGDVIPQRWSPVFIFFAFFTSFTASYSAVRLLDHDLWRTEKEKDHASEFIIKHPQVVAAILLGFGTVWSMHFVGMAAVTLEKAPMCYNWAITIGSLVSAVTFMWAGIFIASRDIFRDKDRIDKLKKVVINKKHVTAKGRHKQAQRTINLVAFFYQPWFILGGSMVAATGALVMHYTGMIAIEGPFRKVWSIPFVSASVLLGVSVCAVGFWILFRLLLWKVEQFWLRPASAAVIALAVCTLHFFGMLSVTYKFDESKVGMCTDRPGYEDDMAQLWTNHQIIALAVGIAVPSLALLIENLICRELFRAYAKLKDPALTVDFILQAGARSRDSNIRRASILTKKALQSQGSKGMNGPPEGMTVEAAAAAAAAAAASDDSSYAQGDDFPASNNERRRSSAASAGVGALSSGGGIRRRSSNFATANGTGTASCKCTCGACCHTEMKNNNKSGDSRRVSFGDNAGPAVANYGRINADNNVGAGEPAKRESAHSHSGSAGSRAFAPTISEEHESEEQVAAALSEISSGTTTPEESNAEIVKEGDIPGQRSGDNALDVEEGRRRSSTLQVSDGSAS